MNARKCFFCGGIVGKECLNPAELRKVELEQIEQAQARLWEIVHEITDPDVYEEANVCLDVLATAALFSRVPGVVA